MDVAVETSWVTQNRLRKFAIQIVLVFLAYCVAAKLGQATTNIRSSNLGPVWPAYGVALAAVILFGYRIGLAVLPAAFLMAFLSPISALVAFGQALGATLAAFTGTFLLRRVVSFQPAMSRLRDALGLIVFGSFGSAIISASAGAALLHGIHAKAYLGLASSWLIYWLGDSTGVLLVTPLILTFPSLLQIRARRRIAELIVLVLLLTATSWVIFGDLPLIPFKLHVLAFGVLPFVMWAAIRFEVMGASLSVLLVATIATVATALGSGPFATNTQFLNAVLLDVFFAVLAVTGLTLASAIAEIRAAQRVREQLAREQALRQRDAELIEAQRVAHLGNWLWDPKTDTVTWSEELYRIHGLDPHQPAPTYREHSRLFTAESWRRLQSVVEEALRTGTPYELDFEIVRADGFTGWIRGRGEALRDTTGEIVQLRGTAQDVTEQKQAEEKLRGSEERFRRVFRDAGIGMVIVSPEGRFLAANDAFCACLGFSEEEMLAKTVESITLPADWPNFSRVLEEALKRGTSFRRVEKRCLHKTGHVVYTESSGSLIRGPGNQPLYFVGEVLDVTERKLAEQAISNVNRKLIEAQEQERIRIARELHDDIGQRLALLAISIEELRTKVEGDAPKASLLIGGLSKLSDEISTDVHAISHRLHSSKLEYLGLVAAMRGFCTEFAEQQRLRIEFVHDDIPRNLPHEVSLCFFRVLQEALHNAAKHSQVRHFEVQLRSSSDEIRLLVSDSGVGFDLESASNMQGLGLVSMRERVKLIHGTIVIESRPMGGTTISVRVPFRSDWISESLDQTG